MHGHTGTNLSPPEQERLLQEAFRANITPKPSPQRMPVRDLPPNSTSGSIPTMEQTSLFEHPTLSPSRHDDVR
jgi:hypothetical protein